MGEQKYYVKLNMLKGSIHKRANIYNANYHPDYVYFLCEDGKSIAPCFENITEWTETQAKANDLYLGKFTKSELAEIEEGMFYKTKLSFDIESKKKFEFFGYKLVSKSNLENNKTLYVYEWTNELIELVPVEEESRSIDE